MITKVLVFGLITGFLGASLLCYAVNSLAPLGAFFGIVGFCTLAMAPLVAAALSEHSK